MRARSLMKGMVAAAVALAPVAASATEAAGVISSVSGNSYVARNGRLLRAVPSMQLVKGDRVVTQANGSAKVAMKDGCTVSVAGSSSTGVSSCDAKAVDFQRAGYNGDSSALRGRFGGTGFVIAILAVGAIVLGVVAATDNGSSRPNSP